MKGSVLIFFGAHNFDMDDIYFSDKKKNSRKDEPSPSKRYVSDKFTDADFDDNSIELELKSN